MKTAIRVLNILTIIGCIIGAVVMILYGCVMEKELSAVGADGLGGTLGIILAFVMLIPAIVCAIANSKVSNARQKSELTAIAIITLLFGNFLSGILMLVINDQDL